MVPNLQSIEAKNLSPQHISEIAATVCTVMSGNPERERFLIVTFELLASVGLPLICLSSFGNFNKYKRIITQKLSDYYFEELLMFICAKIPFKWRLFE